MLTLAATESPGVMLDLVIILATAGLVTLILRRLRMATIPAYLIAGAIIGPSALRLVGAEESIETISHIAVILLMFGLGMHMDPAELRGRFGPILAIGGVAAGVVTGVIALVLVAAGVHWAWSLLVGMAFSMSSTAAVLRLLQQRRELDQVHGRLSFGVLIVQDLLVVGVLALVPLLAREAAGADGEEPIKWMSLLARGLVSIGAIGLLIVVGRIVLPKILEIAAGGGDADVLLVIAGAAALGAAALTSWRGFSAELGAFIAGLLLSATPLRFQISGQLAPMRDLFMAVFFVAVGLNVDVDAALDGWWIVLLGTLGLLILKAGTIGGLAWVVGASAPVAGLAGLALAQGGEFTLVIMKAAGEQGVEFEGGSLLISIVVLSLIVTPWLIQLAHRLAGRLAGVPVAPWIHRSVLRDGGVACATGDRGSHHHRRLRADRTIGRRAPGSRRTRLHRHRDERRDREATDRARAHGRLRRRFESGRAASGGGRERERGDPDDPRRRRDASGGEGDPRAGTRGVHRGPRQLHEQGASGQDAGGELRRRRGAGDRRGDVAAGGDGAGERDDGVRRRAVGCSASPSTSGRSSATRGSHPAFQSSLGSLARTSSCRMRARAVSIVIPRSRSTCAPSPLSTRTTPSSRWSAQTLN